MTEIDTVIIGRLAFSRDETGMSVIRLAGEPPYDKNSDGDMLGWCEGINDEDWESFVTAVTRGGGL